MSPPPRRLTFVVSTSLLTASLSLGVAGCDEERTSNPGPDPAHKGDDKGDKGDKGDAGDKGDKEELHVNEGPEPQPEPKPDPGEKVNPGPEPTPTPEQAPPELNVNTVAPDVEPTPEPVEPKRVNTVPPAGPK